MFIPCMCCGRELPDDWSWWVCDTCGYRVCPSCFPSYKCPKCTWGHMKKTQFCFFPVPDVLQLQLFENLAIGTTFILYPSFSPNSYLCPEMLILLESAETEKEKQGYIIISTISNVKYEKQANRFFIIYHLTNLYIFYCFIIQITSQTIYKHTILYHIWL